MRKFIGTLIFATLIVGPAFGERADKASKSELPLCEIWASTEAPNVPALLEHENWHCWGWTHPVNTSPLLAKTKAERDAYRAYVAPRSIRMLGEYPNKVVYFLTEKDAAKECGSWGCQSGGLQ